MIKIAIGNKSKEELIKVLEEKCGVGDATKELLRSDVFAVSPGERQIDLVRISVRDLGFLEGTTTGEIIAKAKELGFELCPAEVGPQLRIQYMDQPSDEALIIGMEPLKNVHGFPSRFQIGHSAKRNELWIIAGTGDLEAFCGADAEWIFVKI